MGEAVSGTSPIYCLGDSHVNFFSGADVIHPIWPGKSEDQMPWFRTFHLGPILAYNLGQENTTTQGREKLWDILHNAVPTGSRVLLSCGEIDCRAHLLKHCDGSPASVAQVVSECVNRYWTVVEKIAAAGFRPILYNVVPSVRASGRRKGKLETYTAVGTCRERNEVARRFNEELARRCAQSGYPFLGNFPHLVRPNGLSDRWYYMDNIHLSQRAMPLTLHLLRQLVPELGLPENPVPQPPSHWERWNFYWQGRRRRLAKEINKGWHRLFGDSSR